jgi:AcrR family transcriptional regulator
MSHLSRKADACIIGCLNGSLAAPGGCGTCRRTRRYARAIAAKRSQDRYVSAPRRGDARRKALLAAFDELLADHAFADISIADVAVAAGASRPTFYRYFATKSAAVLALLEDFFEEMMDAASAWNEAAPEPAHERLRVTFEASAGYWRARAPLLVALLDGVGSDPEVREIWNSWIDRFVTRIAEQITAEIADGRARAFPDPRSTAIVLTSAAVGVMELDVRAVHAGRPPRDDLVRAATDVWEHTLYARGVADDA